jgi:hypothetical protein
MRLATTLALALCVSLAGPIAAKAAGDQPAEPAGAERMQHWAADRQAMMDARLDDMKDALKLTANQYPLWEIFETAVRNADKARVDGVREMTQNRDHTSPVEHLDLMAGHMARRAAEVKKIAEAAKPFYASLDEAQKRNFGVRWEDLGGDAGGAWIPGHWDSMQ